MKKIVFSAFVVALALATVPAFADPPGGTLDSAAKSNGNNGNGNANSNGKSAQSNGSAVGQASSQIIQNGQFVSGDASNGEDWTCQATSCTGVPGSRAAQVHELLGK